MKKDELYKNPQETIANFKFDRKVTNVFEDMLNRSIPSYLSLQNTIADITLINHQEGTNIYDLGCSTGKTIEIICSKFNDTPNVIGIDLSEPMIQKAKAKFKKSPNISFQKKDITKLEMESPSVVILSFILQFLKTKARLEVLGNIYKNLNNNGVLILCEKILPEKNQGTIHKLYDLYKKNQGYTDTEIEQKKRALKGVLMPLSSKDNEDQLKKIGFKNISIFYQFLNFKAWIAFK